MGQTGWPGLQFAWTPLDECERVFGYGFMGLFLGFMGLIYRGFNVNVLEFSMLRLIMNVGHLGLS